MNFSKYKTLIFDCDGVLLDSNFKKSEAYRMAALDYGATDLQADRLVKHHIENTGISRYVKFEYFLKEIMCQKFLKKNFEFLIKALNKHVLNVLIDCEVAEGLGKLREKTRNQNWMVMSGGDQNEVRNILQEKKIDHYFNYGIYGSPDSKKDIVSQHQKSNKNFNPALFFGDSLYDIKIAKEFDLDFIFMYGWTDYKNWKSTVQKEGFHSVEFIKNLIV
jgi:phosphoglycolate phosphatase-like HAD superfamily hydrolase